MSFTNSRVGVSALYSLENKVLKIVIQSLSVSPKRRNRYASLTQHNYTFMTDTNENLNFAWLFGQNSESASLRQFLRGVIVELVTNCCSNEQQL